MVHPKPLTPFFSIITCTKNSERYIRTCLKSVKTQNFRDFEHIIVDGHSTDDTIKLVSRATSNLISAKPRGIAHAMNLGIAQSRGKYLYFLNSDDSLYDHQVLHKVHDFLVAHPQPDWVFGKIHETDGVHTIGFPPKRKIFQGRHPNILKFYNYIPHQGAFVKKTVFDRFGGFDESLKSMLDPEYWLRIAPHTRWAYMPIVVANYLIRPDSQSENVAHAKQNTDEYELVQSRYLSRLELVLAHLINKLLR